MRCRYTDLKGNYTFDYLLKSKKYPIEVPQLRMTLVCFLTEQTNQELLGTTG